jgi:hypothetical protein
VLTLGNSVLYMAEGLIFYMPFCNYSNKTSAKTFGDILSVRLSELCEVKFEKLIKAFVLSCM